MNLSAAMGLTTPVNRENTCCLDWDGTLAKHYKVFDPQDAGELNPHGLDLLRALKADGFRVVVLTARSELGPIKQKLEGAGFPDVQVTNVKPPAIAYVDDRGVEYHVGKPISALVKKVVRLRDEYLPVG